MVVLLVVGYFATRPPPLQVPDRIAGVSKLTSPTIQSLNDRMVQDAGGLGKNPVAAVYGLSGRPEFVMFAAQGTESADDDAEGLKQAAQAFSTEGVGIDLSSATTEERAGVRCRCAPLSGGGLAGSICIWNDGKTLGMVVWFSERGHPSTFAAQVHDAVVG